jgi:ferredoxin
MNPDPETQQAPWHGVPTAAATAGAFEVVCARSGQSLHVPPDTSVIAVLLDAGLEPNYSCLGEGVCGACEIPVLGCDGELDHRDGVLSAAERAVGKTLIVCVSRCKGTRLVLDI